MLRATVILEGDESDFEAAGIPHLEYKDVVRLGASACNHLYDLSVRLMSFSIGQPQAIYDIAGNVFEQDREIRQEYQVLIRHADQSSMS